MRYLLLGVVSVVVVLFASAGDAPVQDHRRDVAPAPSPPKPLEQRAGTSTCLLQGTGLGSAPDRSPACTPGAWVADPDLSTAHVCRTGYNRRPPLRRTAALKRQALALYGLPSRTTGRESDHLYPVWAGGASVIRNLWPEPNYARPPSAYVENPKDQLEFVLYTQTCRSRVLTVPQARRVLEGDWREAYRTYVGPLP